MEGKEKVCVRVGKRESERDSVISIENKYSVEKLHRGLKSLSPALKSIVSI